MEKLAEICQSEKISKNGTEQNYEESYSKNRENYLIFSEQFLEKPYVSPKAWLTLSGTICTWRGKETIDDPDVD